MSTVSSQFVTLDNDLVIFPPLRSPSRSDLPSSLEKSLRTLDRPPLRFSLKPCFPKSISGVRPVGSLMAFFPSSFRGGFSQPSPH